MKLRVYSFEKPLLSMSRGEPPGDFSRQPA